MALVYRFRMDKDLWKKRIRDAIAASGRTSKEISVSAGFGANFVQQMLRDGKTPSVSNMERLCRELGVTYTYIMTGKHVTGDLIKLIEIWEDLTPEDQAHVLFVADVARRARRPTE
jgi:transcriptional regulator with XRE-family HTH domain